MPQARAAGSSGRPGTLRHPGSGRGLRRGFPGTMCRASVACHRGRMTGWPAALPPPPACAHPARPMALRPAEALHPLGKVTPALTVWGPEGLFHHPSYVDKNFLKRYCPPVCLQTRPDTPLSHGEDVWGGRVGRGGLPHIWFSGGGAPGHPQCSLAGGQGQGAEPALPRNTPNPAQPSSLTPASPRASPPAAHEGPSWGVGSCRRDGPGSSPDRRPRPLSGPGTESRSRTSTPLLR